MVQFRTDHSETGSQLPDIPFGLAKNSDAAALPIDNGRIQVSREQLQQRGFSAAVGAQERRVFSLVHTPANPVEDAVLASDQGDVLQVQDSVVAHAIPFASRLRLANQA